MEELERDQPECEIAAEEEREEEAKREVKRIRDEIKDEREDAKEEAQRIRDEAENEDPSPVINERILKITGSVNIDKELPWGTEIGVVLKGSLVKTELKDNNDGSWDKIYKVKITTLEQVEKI